jgi:5-methylcytosine-specific restriction enzyme subunit McrC
MIRATVREWGYLEVSDEPSEGAVTRSAADALLGIARTLRVGGADGESILLDGRRRLRAQQVVGVLSAREASLEILPKIDNLDAGATRRNLVHMLARVLDLEVSAGALDRLDWQREDLLELLIRLFCDQLFEAVRRGLPRSYIGCEDDLPALRGRLDATRQFTVMAATPNRLACRYDELSPDIPLNQIMKAVLARLAVLARSPENRRRLAELALAFADVTAIPPSALAWERVILDRTNATWSGLLTLARLLLGKRFQTTSFGGGHGFALLFEMNTLFEEYVGRTLRRALAGSDLKVQLQGPRDHALEDEQGARRFATRPDVVITRGGSPVLVLDTKWKRLSHGADDPKRGVGQADVYQMMAYAQVYACGRLALLYPHTRDANDQEGLLQLHRVRGAEDVRLAIASLDLTQLKDVEARLGRLVGRLVENEQMAEAMDFV